MNKPLADRIRPTDLNDVVGQRHLLSPDKALYNMIQNGDIPNLIFYGPSGVGKTTVASIIANKTKRALRKLNGTNASTQDIRDIVSQLDTFEAPNGILLYLDEIPAVKRGFDFLSKENNIEIDCDDEAVKKIAVGCGGDVRKALNSVENCYLATPTKDNKKHITTEIASELTQKSAMRYDRDGDEHYDIVSAYQKSMRGSDVNAALHYLARLLEAGDLPSACRRLMVCACEDVGLAYPQIIPIVKAAVDAAMMVGLPEARIPLADAVIMVASAPKSNSGEAAIDAAMADVKKGNFGPIPRTLQNKHYDGEDAEVKGQHYIYPHPYPNHWVDQQYLPDKIKDAVYYNYGNNKNEQKFKEYWQKVKGKKL